MEDFGFSGDEFMLGDCMGDWTGYDEYNQMMREREDEARRVEFELEFQEGDDEDYGREPEH